MKRFLFIALLALTPASHDFAQAITPTPAPAPAIASSVNPAQLVVDIYNIALSLGGFLAFGAIVWGAVQYSISAGNPSGQHEAKEWITQALVGLMLLFGAFMVLRTIDPKLTTNLELVPLTTLTPITNTNNPNCQLLPLCTWTPAANNPAGCDGPYQKECNQPKTHPVGCNFTAQAVGVNIPVCTPTPPTPTPTN